MNRWVVMAVRLGQVDGARRRLAFLLGISLLLWSGNPACGASKTADSSRQSAVRKLAAMIDERIDARLQAEGVVPSPMADDAEYFRRVWLHLAGTIPPVSEVRRFLSDPSEDKRERVVAELLSRPSYVRNFTTFWRRSWLPEADTDQLVQARVPIVESWLRQQLLENRRYDEIVRDLVAVPIPQSAAVAASLTSSAESGPVAFLLAKEAKPDALAASTSRAFLGVRLDCAQCHDHPFDTWKRNQFWSFAAFFAGLERGDSNLPTQPTLLREVADRRELMIPETDQLVSAVFLDGSEPRWRSRSGRELLAEWITSPENPYFARAAVNRLWGHLFGIGLVDPVDDFSSANAASHPELLDDLAAAFIARNFDVRFLLRAMMASDAYQRTSRQLKPDVPPQLYASMPVQGLSAEQLVRSLSQVVDAGAPAAIPDPSVFASPDELSPLFLRPGESPTQRQTTILQALTLMNGRTTGNAVDLEAGTLLAAVLDFPGMTRAERIETLFLGTLSRFPTPAEAERCLTYVAAADDPKSACADVLWALLNSAEFGCNH